MKTFFHIILVGSSLSLCSAEINPPSHSGEQPVQPPSIDAPKAIPKLGVNELKIIKPNVGAALEKRKQEQARKQAIRENDGVLAKEDQPKTTCFQRTQIKKGINRIAGSIRVIKAGAHSRVVFTTFKEPQTFYNKFGNKELEAKMLKKLKDGKPLPVMMTGYFEESVVRAGSKVSNILVLNYVYSCEFVSEETICKAAKLEGFSDQDCQKFSTFLKH